MFGIGKVTTEIAPCSKERFYEAIESKEVAKICDLIATLQLNLNNTADEKKQKWCRDRISSAKRCLPVITPMATFKDNKRKVANAIPSGWNMLDVDHIDNPRDLWERSKDKIPYEVGLVHITPSGMGLRIVFRQPSGMSIADAQLNLARAINVEYDACTKDLARCSFLVKKDYFIVINDVVFEKTEQQTTECLQVQEEQQVEKIVEETANISFPTEFKGIPYSDLISIILVNAGYDETPTLGERNNALYMLARNLRYVCDFNPLFIRSVLPDWQLPEHEVMATIDHAVKSVRMSVMPKVLSKLINDITKQRERQQSAYFESSFTYEVDCTGLIGKFVALQPQTMRNAAYLTAMTCLGTLLTRLRGRGCDGSVISPNFMLCVSAPQATGKQFMKRIYEQICKPIIDEDKKQRLEQRKIDKENKKNKDKEGYEEKEFEGVIRCLPSNTSNRILLERLDLAKSKHCIIMAEEIDSITKAEKSGKWSEKSDIYRLAYDNAEWGMDYASENSYKAVVPVYLNLLFSGTPAAVARFFTDIENGLVTRFLFVDLPDTYGQKRPMRKFLSDDESEEINSRLLRLYQQMENPGTEDGLIWMDTSKMVEDAINLYDEVQRLEYLGNQEDVARDLARRRYADYVVKMMMIETWLNDGVYTEEIRDRVISVMNVCTDQLIANYGEELNASLNSSVEKQEEAKVKTKKQSFIELLPDTFTTLEATNIAKDSGYSDGKGSNYINMILRRLEKGGVIKKVERGLYKKTQN